MTVLTKHHINAHHQLDAIEKNRAKALAERIETRVKEARAEGRFITYAMAADELKGGMQRMGGSR